MLRVARWQYTQEVDEALRRHEKALRLIYDRACQLHGTTNAKEVANKLLDEGCWAHFCTLFGLVDKDLTDRDANRAFACSRMRVVDGESEMGRIKLTHLAFEDFLEALCRCSVCKAWPARFEIYDKGTGNAGEHLLRLKSEDPEAHAELLQKRAAGWGQSPLQPLAMCIEMLCELLIVTCKLRKGEGSLELSEGEVSDFMKIGVQ